MIQPETDAPPAAQNKRTSSILSLGFSTVLPKRVSGGGRGSIKVMNPAKDHTYHGILLRELNFATHDSVEPRYMFRQARVAKAGFGNFDEEGVPQSINQGEPLSAEAAAWCRQEHSAMGQRRATEAAVVDNVGRVLRGDRELSAKTAKVLAAELRRRDDLKKRVTHPKKMFLGASSSGDDPKAASGLSFRGMFSIWDEIGRPTAGVKVADATVPMTLSQPTIKVLHAAHRLQGQRYIDFYKPKLEAIRNVSTADGLFAILLSLLPVATTPSCLTSRFYRCAALPTRHENENSRIRCNISRSASTRENSALGLRTDCLSHTRRMRQRTLALLMQKTSSSAIGT